jgi:hypothetical protein
MPETGTKLETEPEPKGEVLNPEPVAPNSPATNLLDLLMTHSGEKLAASGIEAFKTYTDAQRKERTTNTAILAVVIMAALACGTYLSIIGKFDGAMGTLVGTLVGFLVGRKTQSE